MGRIKKIVVIYDNEVDIGHVETAETIGESDIPIEAMKDARDWLDFSIKAAGIITD